MCTELEVTMQGQPRTSAEREILMNKWDELSNYQIGKNKDEFRWNSVQKETENILDFRFGKL